MDKLKDQGQQVVKTEDGQELSKRLKAYKYIECSARTLENVKEIFDESVRAAIIGPKKRRNICVVL